MNEAEFDKFAEEYYEMHKGVLRASGESPYFFAEYKVKDTAARAKKYGFQGNLSVLDFGGGIGGSVPFFMKHLPESSLTCLDVSRKSLSIAEKRYPDQARFVHFDGRHIPFNNNNFHLVFTACVFHHIPQNLHNTLLTEIYRVLKPGGLFIAFEHNPYNFLTVKAVNSCPFDENAVLIRGKDFRNQIAQCNFVNAKLCYRIFFPGILRLLRPLEQLIKWLPLGAQYYVCAQKPF